ncbi:hypothetical protein ELE36_03320 [Pseudolysobacter antarcticus]|uniref:Gingipain domain-containing protein n=1 Tax=Pseudolysobacter antarcticus TaxID=2511995 RepID=A0A411HG97_9GAMM|nr:C25 family cysteine peptidase [Pseudolysobacter antarcticus]QBB69484.1 hypothetical protein ELE36_03320 [Pseudolysobacter antarcticus]
MIHRRLFFLGALSALFHAASAIAAPTCSGSLHIELQQAGVYALDYASIIASQPGLQDCTSADLVLRNQDKEIPLRVLDSGDGKFGPKSGIEWIGEPLHGPASWFDQYSIANVYLLSAEPGQHARMHEQTGSAAVSIASTTLTRRLHLEQDNLMIRLNQMLVKPGEEPDVWQWAKLTHADAQPFSFDFDLADFAGKRDTEISATLDFRGLSDVPPSDGVKSEDHAVQMVLNGSTLPSISWDGREEVRKKIRIPAHLLKARGNTLTLRVPVRHADAKSDNPLVDVVMFNFIELDYPIGGSLDASTAPFMLDGKLPARIELQQNGTHAPAVYTAKGVYMPVHAAGNSRWNFDHVPANVTLYPLANAQPLVPSRLLAVAAGDLRKTDSGFDYLIVAHPRLIAAIEPLAEFHRSHGLKVAVIDVNQIYDQFNGGIDHPRAIRNLVQYGVEHWPTKPRFVLLVGDASFDIRHENPDDASMAKWATHDYELLIPDHFDGIPATAYGTKPKDLVTRNLIPTWQFPSEEGQSASDNPFVTFTTDDFHPTVAIGRFPVVEPSDVTAIVNKTIAYFTKPQPGSWRRDVMFIANEDSYFQTASDEIAAQLETEGFAARKIYGDAAEKDNLAHQSDIKQSLNDGQLLVHFLGHGGRFIWRTGPPDLRKNHDLFTLDDVSQLQNGARLPMVLSMTCYSAPFDNPTEDSIGERFLREPDKGAVAVFAASWRNSPDPAYSKALIAELLTPSQTIGAAIIKAKRKISDRTLVETYNLLGDPALVLDRPKDTLALARGADRWSTQVAVKLPGNSFHGMVNVDWLNATGKVLQSVSYNVDEARFTLPPPSTAQTPAGVLVYAADPSVGRDAIGELSLLPPPINPATNDARQRDALMLALDAERWHAQPQIKVALPGSEFHGQVSVDWQDIKGKSLAKAEYRADAPRFALPAPPAQITAQLAQVHVLTSDPQQDHDAFGRIYLVDPPVKGVLISDPQLTPQNNLPDKISKLGFDTGATGTSKIVTGQAKVSPVPAKENPG